MKIWKIKKIPVIYKYKSENDEITEKIKCKENLTIKQLPINQESRLRRDEWRFQNLKSILIERIKEKIRESDWRERIEPFIYKEKNAIHGYTNKENWKT